MQITLQLRPETALPLHRGQETAESADLIQTASDLGFTLEPMHPGVEDPVLATYFIVDVADDSRADQALERLRALRSVEAAYVKPRDEAPRS